MKRVGKIALCASLLLLRTSCFVVGQNSAIANEPVAHIYREVGGVQLAAYVFTGASTDTPPGRPAIVLFHGGGWTMGEPQWAFARAKHFAELGMVAVAAQYRLSDRNEITPLEAVSDARTVIRWMRRHAGSLGIDPEHIAAYGWSAGAHLAVSAAIFDDDDSGEELSSAPNALVLVSPAVSLSTDTWFQGLLGRRAAARDVSPAEHVREGLPPTLMLQGSADTVTPLNGVKLFCERLRAAENTCELHVYQGFGHLFTPAGIRDDGTPRPDPAVSADASARADRFLKSLGFLP